MGERERISNPADGWLAGGMRPTTEAVDHSRQSPLTKRPAVAVPTPPVSPPYGWVGDWGDGVASHSGSPVIPSRPHFANSHWGKGQNSLNRWQACPPRQSGGVGSFHRGR